MANKEFSCPDAQPSALYAKRSSASNKVYPIKLDNITGAFSVVDYPHHEIHGGSHYIINEVYDLGNGAVIDVRFLAPDTTKWAHMLLGFDTESEYEWWLYETDPIVTAGTTYIPRNLNRNSSNVSGLAVDIISTASIAVAATVTNTASSIILMHGITGAGKVTGGSGECREEVILKQNTAYLFRAVANAAGWISGNMGWYEHTNEE